MKSLTSDVQSSAARSRHSGIISPPEQRRDFLTGLGPSREALRLNWGQGGGVTRTSYDGAFHPGFVCSMTPVSTGWNAVWGPFTREDEYAAQVAALRSMAELAAEVEEQIVGERFAGWGSVRTAGREVGSDR